ncbi:PREDICTED: RING finger protein 165-like [Ipomoea nil]|uniref:RING finger protein 165-like n=1 Tax=Ipomoea nil TaxID=35883 RepID=UPI000901CAFE|nr:PREDICTED: RING finger protein 165-like [Ipomoea nil]
MDDSILNVDCWIRHEPEILRTAAYVLPPQDVFVFQMKVKDMVGLFQFHPEAQSPSQRYILDYWEHHFPHLSMDFVIPFPNIAGSGGRNRARHKIHEMLGAVGIPRQKRRPLLGKIYSEAMRLANKAPDGEYKRIPIMVVLRRAYARTRVRNDDVESEVVPASRSGEIEGLERVMVEETEACAVCLEEMEAGSEGSMLPCRHIFHGRCIDAWFAKAISCPLCRFQLSCRALTSPQIFEDGWN